VPGVTVTVIWLSSAAVRTIEDPLTDATVPPTPRAPARPHRPLPAWVTRTAAAVTEDAVPLPLVGWTATHSPATTSENWAAVSWVTCVDGVTSTVAGPFGPVTITVPPDTEATRPNVLSLPAGAAVGAGAVGDELGAADELVAAGAAVLLDDADGVLDEPQAASEAAAQTATVTAAHRDTREEMTMRSRSVRGLLLRFDGDVRSLWERVT
jgi:hypothetical protein